MNAKIYCFIHPEGGTVTTMDADRIEYYVSGGYVEVCREAYKLHSDFYNLYGECGMLGPNAQSIIEAEKAKETLVPVHTQLDWNDMSEAERESYTATE